jgi:hypothetical protein
VPATDAVIVALALPGLTPVEENCTVIPEGRGLADSVTFELKPFAGVIVICVEADVPGAAEMLDGDAFSVNEGDVTVTEKLAWLVKLPLVPVTVTVYNPAETELAAVIATALVPDPGAAMVEGVKPTVSPIGETAVRTTAPLKPLAIALVSVKGAPAPGETVTPGTLVVSVNGGTTVKWTLVDDVIPSPVPVTVMVAEPGTAVAPTVIVSTLDPAPGAATLGGARVAVTPAGAPLTVSATALLNPPAILTITVDVPLVPCGTVNDPDGIDRFIDGKAPAFASSQKLTRSLAFTEPNPVA